MPVNHIVFDVDGTLTDGGIILSSDGTEIKRFDVKDGLVIGALPTLGFTTMFLTGRNSELTRLRAAELKINIVLQNVSNKYAVLKKYIDDNNLSWNQFAYIGDDINDYEAMKPCAFKACPSDAVEEIRIICDHVSAYRGGHGAARDICKYLLKQQRQYNDFVSLYGLGEEAH